MTAATTFLVILVRMCIVYSVYVWLPAHWNSCVPFACAVCLLVLTHMFACKHESVLAREELSVRPFYIAHVSVISVHLCLCGCMLV